MTNVLGSPEEVKHIVLPVALPTGNWAAFLETDRAIIDAAIVAGTIDLSDLFYTPEEVDHPDAFCHETNVVGVFDKDGTFHLPLKDVAGLPFPQSRPADFKVQFHDFPKPVEVRGVGLTPTVVFLSRDPQPGEITQQHIGLVNRLLRVRDRNSQDPDPHHQVEPPGQDPDRHLHVVPAGEPRPKAVSPQLLLSLFRIPVRALAWPLSLGLPFGACVLYLITRQFPAARRQSTEKLYCDAGAKQLTEYMTLFKPILLRNAPDHLQHQAKSLKITFRAVRYWHTRLRDAALVVPVSPPEPGVRTSRRLVACNEKERRETLPLARRVRARPKQPHKALKP